MRQIKTTAPKNYTVKPNLGYLNPSERLALEILTHSGVFFFKKNIYIIIYKSGQISPNDKFQILAKECDDKVCFLFKILK